MSSFVRLRDELKKQVEDTLEVRKTLAELKRSVEAKTQEASHTAALLAEKEKEIARIKRQHAAKEDAVEVLLSNKSYGF